MNLPGKDWRAVLNNYHITFYSWDKSWSCGIRMLCVSDYDLEVFELMLSLRLLWFPFFASLWHLSLSLFSFLSALFFCPLFLSLWRADGRQLGCDPITDWLHQSPSADWFYNPHLRSQMGENQRVKKHCAAIKLHAGTLTHAQTHGNIYTHTYIRTPSFLVQILFVCGGIAKI